MINNATEALALFERSSISLETILSYVEDSAKRNRRFVRFEGWPSDAVVAELIERGFRVELNDVLIPDTRINW